MSQSFISLLLHPLNHLIQRFLAQDPDYITVISALAPNDIAIDITDLSLTLTVRFTTSGITVAYHTESDAALTISGNSTALARLIREPGHLFSDAITIHGDIQFAKKLQDSLTGLSIDWEAQLSKLTGDTLAYPIMTVLRQLAQITRQYQQSMEENIRDYLQHEIQILPSSYQISPLLNDVDTLRADVDRLAARIERLRSI